MQDDNCCRLEVDINLISNAKKFLQSNEKILQQNAKIFALLGNEVRLKIVRLLMEYERMCVCDLADVLQMKQSPISQHLRKLKDASFLVNERQGMTIFYSLSASMREELEAIVKG